MEPQIVHSVAQSLYQLLCPAPVSYIQFEIHRNAFRLSDVVCFFVMSFLT